MKSKVAVILVNWNHYKDTAECLLSLQAMDYLNCVLIVVDNASDDDSVLRLRKHFPEIILIENTSNVGLAAANNQGLRVASEQGAEFSLILNNDTVVASDLITNFVFDAFN